MEILSIGAALVALVIVGTLLNNIFPKIPTSLFQILLGILFAFLPISDKFNFDSATFISLVIAPLLFTDAYNISRSKFWLYKKPILLMAVALVLITVLIVGTVVHWLLPSIPVPAAFALAAILSPTDAVAVKSITKGMKLPKGLMDILEGESLLNDAAGLVSFNIAIAAVLSGTFSLPHATQDFFRVGLGGAIIGAILGVILVYAKDVLARFSKNESSTLVIFQILTPVVVYLIAEHEFHVSGIVAVVITALIYNLDKDISQMENLRSESAILIANNQTTVSYILNGFVFVFLGYLIPGIFSDVINNPQIHIYQALLYVVIITLVMMLVRFLFVYIFYIHFPVHSFSSVQKLTKTLADRKLDIGNYSHFEYALITSLSGIHGTITIATALMIPLTIASSGEDFPLRATLLFIASCVVIASMVIGTVFLPILVKISKVEEVKKSPSQIRSKAILTSIQELEKDRVPYEAWAYSNADDDKAKEQIAFAMIIKKLYEQSMFYSSEIESKKNVKSFFAINKEIYRKEKEKIKEFKKEGKYNTLLITIQEIRHLRKAKLVSYNVIRQMILQFNLARKEAKLRRIIRHTYIKTRGLRRIEKSEANSNTNTNIINEAVTDQFKDHSAISSEFNAVTENVLSSLGSEHPRIAKEVASKNFNNFKNVLFIRFINEPNSYHQSYENLWVRAISIQKAEIMKMRNLGEISHHEADIIFKEINYSEALLFTHE